MTEDISIKVEASKTLSDGMHYGTIEEIKMRETEFSYVNLSIRCDEGILLNVGYPARISENSSLGRLMQRFGVRLVIGQEIKLKGGLLGRRVQFITTADHTTDGRTYARILRDTLKPYDVPDESDSPVIKARYLKR